ncbi:MAG: M48 family metalloprotease [Pseudomonadales bacterium]|nr:M48 family metalloprotease [Pseudomonadales bacterium]
MKNTRSISRFLARVISTLALPTFLLAGVLSGCATNPVTGKNEISLVSENWELKTGAQNYLPARQSQGGDYVADPQVQAYVQEVGNKLAAVSDRDLPYEFAVINNSVPNAWAMPGGKIAINRGLLTELSSEAELAAVLGHEIVHAAAKHSAQAVQRGVMLQAAVLATGIATKDSDYGQVATIGAGAGAALINSKYGRDDERESDVYGMNYMSRAGYNPLGAVELQQTFVALKDGKAANFLEGLFASHPPSQERVATNRQHAATLPKGGIEGRLRYKQMMTRLIDSQPAYEAYDEAQQAVADNRLKAARRLVQQAIDSEPREGHFYALLGDIEADEDDLNAADRAYDQAVNLNPNFFYPLMRSGVINERQGRIAKAKRRLNRSLELLETAEAYNTLGAIAEREGNLRQAEEYYARAAQDSGVAGQTALTSLVALRSKSNPAALVSLRWGIGTDGKVLIEATNKTPRTLIGIDLQIRLVDAQGVLRSYNQRLGSLSPGQIAQVNTGFRPGSGQVQLSVESIDTVQGS